MAEIALDVGAGVTIRALLISLRSVLAWACAVLLAALIVALVYIILWPLNVTIKTLTHGAVSSIPGSHAVARAAVGALHSQVIGLDRQLGKFFVAWRLLYHQAGREILGLAVVGVYAAWYVSHKLNPARIGKSIAHTLDVAKTARSIAHTAEHDAHLAYRYARTHVRRLGHRMSAAEHAIDTTIPAELKSARDLAREAEDLAGKAWDYLRSHPWTVVTGAFVGMVEVALSRLGLGWLKCRSNPFNNNSKACGLWGDLSALLGLASTVLVAADFEALVRQMGSLEADVVDGFYKVWRL